MLRIYRPVQKKEQKLMQNGLRRAEERTRLLTTKVKKYYLLLTNLKSKIFKNSTIYWPNKLIINLPYTINFTVMTISLKIILKRMIVINLSNISCSTLRIKVAYTGLWE